MVGMRAAPLGEERDKRNERAKSLEEGLNESQTQTHN